jgi:hypothetical protein
MQDEPVCPECSSTLVTEISNMKRCNACGHQWGLDRHPIVTVAADRKARRAPSTGFNPHEHASAGLADLEASLNEAEQELREASRRLFACKREARAGLLEVERLARHKRDSLLATRAELVNSR